MSNSDEEVIVRVGAESDTSKGLSEAADSVSTAVASMVSSLGELTKASAEAADQQETHTKAMGETWEGAAQKVEHSGKNMEESFGALGKSLAGLTLIIEKTMKHFHTLMEIVGGGLLLHAIGGLGAKSAEYADEILRASEKTGLATDKLQELKYAAEANHVSFGQLQNSLQRIAVQMSAANTGNATAVTRFKELGVSLNDLKTNDPVLVFEKMSDRFKETANDSNKLTNTMQMLGRGGKELIPMMNGGSEAVRELAAEFREMGGVMDRDALVQAKKFEDQLHQMHTVGEILERIISSALIPAFLAVGKAFITSSTHGGMMRDVVEGLATFIRYLSFVTAGLIEALQWLGMTIGAVSEMIAHPTRTKTIWSTWSDEIHKLTEEGKKMRAEMLAPPPAPALVTGRPSLVVTNRKTPAHDTRLEEWRSTLEKMKEAEGYFHEFSKTAEAAYWQAKLALIDQKTKEGVKLYRQVDSLRYQAARAAAHEEEDAYQQEVHNKLAAVRINYAAQLAIINENMQHIKEKYGEDSKQFKAEQEKQVETKRKIVEELAKLDGMMAESAKRRADAAIDRAQNTAAFELEMGRITADKKIAGDIELENRRYQIAIATAQKKLDLERATGQLSYEQERSMMQAVEDLTLQHETKILQLKQAAIKEAAKYQIEASASVRQTFTTLLTDLGQGVKGLKKSFMDFFNGIGKNLNDVAAKKFTDMLMGPGTSAGGAIDSLMTKLFGGSAASSASAITGATGATAANTAMLTLSTTTAAETAAQTALTAANTAAAAVMATLTAAATSASAAMSAMAVSSAASSAAPAIAAVAVTPLASGTNYVPQDMLAYVHKGEQVTPAKYVGKEGGGSIQQNNYFTLHGPVDTRTQDQIGMAAARGISRASNRTTGR